MRFGLDLAQQRVPFAELIERAGAADEWGFDGVWGSGHTSKARLGLLVAGVTYRHPVPVDVRADRDARRGAHHHQGSAHHR